MSQRGPTGDQRREGDAETPADKSKCFCKWQTVHVSLLQALDYNTVKTLLSDTKTLCQILDEAVSLLKMFWRAALPSSDGPVYLIQRVRTSTSFGPLLMIPKK